MWLEYVYDERLRVKNVYSSTQMCKDSKKDPWLISKFVFQVSLLPFSEFKKNLISGRNPACPFYDFENGKLVAYRINRLFV